MLTCTVDTDGLRRAMQRTKVALNRTIPRCVDKAAQSAVAEAKRGAWKDRSGRLRKEIRKEPTRMTAREATAWVSSPTPYAPFVEWDTRPHWIRPKQGHGFVGPLLEGQSRRDITDIGTHRIALRWYVGGKPIFRRKVYHRGTAGKRYMHKARLHAEVALREYLQDGFVGLQSIWN